MKNIADTMHARIDELGLRTAAVAEQTGLTDHALRAMLNHRRKIYALDFIRLCKLLQLTPEDFEDAV